MMIFPINDLMDEQKCYDYLLRILHVNGLRCKRCGTPVEQCKVHRRNRAPILFHRCPCGCIFNAFAGTVFQGTHRKCSHLVLILQGVAQGKPTLHLARELGCDDWHLLELRHKLQENALLASPPEALKDAVVECDEMYQNAGEKRRPA